MTDKAAMSGTYSNFRIVRGRKVCIVEIELPLEAGDAFIRAFGMPQPGAETHVAIARLDIPAKQESPPQAKPEPVRSYRPFEELPLPQQIALRCRDLEFRQWLHSNYKDVKDEASAAARVRWWCDVQSRKDILPGTEAERQWMHLEARFQKWKLRQAA